MTGSVLGMPGQLANESIAEYRQRFETQLALIAAEEQRQLSAEAVRLQAEAAATAEKQRLQAEAEADTQARRKEAQDLLQWHEATSIKRLKFWHFEPSEEHDDATPEEQHKEFMAKLITSTFAAPATISKQLDTLKTEVQQLHQLPNNNGKTSAQHYKMPTFRIEKFDDYTHQDPVPWWEGFTTKLRILFVPEHSYIGALFLNSKGGCQIWLSHLTSIHGVQVADLHEKISWEELTKLWKKRFIVDDAPALAINHLFAMTQGNTLTRDWVTEWQKIAATPDLDLPFSHLRREFYNRSCAALSLALGDREQYTTFAEIIDKARRMFGLVSTRETKLRRSRSLDEHVEHLRNVLERLRQAKYKANRDKCEFARQELEYSGHYVTPQGIRPLADKIEVLRIWPEPTNTTDVRSFMGLVGYYQRFITGYSRIAAPMTRLQLPKMPFVFDDDARRSFQALKTAMLMAPILSIYDPTLPTRVTTETSGYGIRAVLEQYDDDD
ncbi:hypothetical protein CBR_g38656 [Chara braunii]|uniref:Reverse transcriptase/retrotransposon-derived protein RNase H-like domain-containing protein n=1 Tax=Chara braunii TaxID=69332 RepID=A0A388K0J7_CHABU|nr:hypothetical protein CBR_g38656 [Chara braunii]|eukprot:GBG63590.1 hypothetical protein CBR_g38656 [Chara braunii]